MCLGYRAELQKTEERLRHIRNILKLPADPDIALWIRPEDVARLRQALIEPADHGHGLDVLDTKFRNWGEEWVGSGPITFEPDDWVNARTAGTILGVNANTVGVMRQRGRLVGKWQGSHEGYFYQVKDLWRLQSEKRGRSGGGQALTDRVQADGSSVP